MVTTVCSVDGCTRTDRLVRGWCIMHYNRWYTTGSLETTKVVRYTCTVEGCERRHDARGYCSMHHKRWMKHGDVEFVHVGPNHANWAENPTYGGMHIRLRKLKGRATTHNCADCGNPATDWSYMGGDPDERVSTDESELAYSVDPAFYVARCKLCHKRHDNSVRLAGLK